MKIDNRRVRAARPTPPPPAPKPKPKPAPRPIDELSTGHGFALRRDAAARLGGGYAPASTPTVAPAASYAKALPDGEGLNDEQLDRVLESVESIDDVVLLTEGVLPGEVHRLTAAGIPDEWVDDLPDEVRDQVIAGVFERRPDLFITPGHDSTFRPGQREQIAEALGSALESGELTPDEALRAAESLGEAGPVALVSSLLSAEDVDESTLDDLADALFESDVPGAQAAAAVYYTSSPSRFAANLSDSGDQATAMIALTGLVESDALGEISDGDTAFQDALYGEVVDSAMTLFADADPGMMQLLLNDERSDRDFGVLESFFENVLFEPSAIAALEERGWEPEELQSSVEDAVQGFVDHMTELGGVTDGDVVFSTGTLGAGRLIGRLFGLLETASDAAISGSAGETGRFANFAKDLAFGAAAAGLAAVITNPALAAAAPVVLRALGANVSATGEVSFEEAQAALAEQLGEASDLDAGADARLALTNALGVLRGQTHDDPELNLRLGEFYDGIESGSQDAINYRN